MCVCVCVWVCVFVCLFCHFLWILALVYHSISSSSSSSSHDDNTDYLDSHSFSLSLSLSVIALSKSSKRHPVFAQSFPCKSIGGNLLKNVNNEFVTISPAVPSLSSCLDCLWDVRQMAVQLLFYGWYFQDFSKHYAASLFCSHLAFTPSSSLKSRWCNYTLVQIRIQFGRIPGFFFHHVVDNQSILFHTFP